jgi:hypothetical protein
MKTILTVLAASALFASGAALACDDLSHHADAQASKAPDTAVVIAEKAEAPQAAKKPVAKQKTPAKSVAQASAPLTRTAAN